MIKPIKLLCMGAEGILIGITAAAPAGAAAATKTASGASVSGTAAAATGTSSARVGTASKGAKTANVVSPKYVAGCGFNAMPAFQITAGSNWYAEGKITSCTSPAPDSCNFSVDLQELVNNEWSGPEWVKTIPCE